MRQKDLSIIIPVYNEPESLPKTVLSVETALDKSDLRYEIIVVNDGCTDDTCQRFPEILESHKRIRLVEHQENRGYGAAIKTGISEAQYELVAIIDADQTYPAEVLPEMAGLSANYDMVVAARTSPGSHTPLIRRPAKAILKWLCEALTWRKIPDMNSGLRVFKRDIALKFLHLLPDGFSLTSTITLLWLNNNHTIHYIPIRYEKRVGKSKIRPISDTLNFMQLILRTVMYTNPLRIFLPASLIFFSIGLALYLYRVLIAERFLITTLVMFFCGFQLLLMGALADLIDKRMR
jgi:glycosyltransferase involved in cell wall biosynthesis